jgi:hypothetical protein
MDLTMRHLTRHGKFLTLSSALLLVPAAFAVLTGCGLLTDHASDKTADAFDRIVPGMTRADDLAGLGFDLQGAAVADAATLGRIEGRAADACLAADRFCTGYVFAARGGQVVLLVMDGRVTQKVLTRA